MIRDKKRPDKHIDDNSVKLYGEKILSEVKPQRIRDE